jgi:hypothetical protein
MIDRDAISAELPPPREDEPAALRQDILDELADHLGCAYNRELLRGTGPVEARRRMLERFGDPAAVARRLWFDATKGRIMAQRILIATCFVMVAVCFLLVGYVLSESYRWSQSNLGLFNQAQRTNQEMLKQLEALASSAKASTAKADEWIPVTFRLSLETPDGLLPAVGYQVVVGRGSGGTAKGGAIQRTSDANGQADFGVVQPGDWEYQIQAGGWSATGALNAVPGTAVEKQVVCPKAPPDLASVKVRVDWPADLADKGLRALALFRHAGITYEEPVHWVRSSSVQLLCGPKAEMAETGVGQQNPGGIDRSYRIWRPKAKWDENDVHPHPAQDDLHGPNRFYMDLGSATASGAATAIEIDAGNYGLTRLIILRPAHVAPDAAAGDQFEVLGLFDREGASFLVEVVTVLSQGGEQMARQYQIQGLKVRSSRRREDRFEAQPDKTAEWAILVPDELIKVIRRKLKADA